jgi:hypothetical protein
MDFPFERRIVQGCSMELAVSLGVIDGRQPRLPNDWLVETENKTPIVDAVLTSV